MSHVQGWGCLFRGGAFVWQSRVYVHKPFKVRRCSFRGGESNRFRCTMSHDVVLWKECVYFLKLTWLCSLISENVPYSVCLGSNLHTLCVIWARSPSCFTSFVKVVTKSSCLKKLTLWWLLNLSQNIAFSPCLEDVRRIITNFSNMLSQNPGIQFHVVYCSHNSVCGYEEIFGRIP